MNLFYIFRTEIIFLNTCHPTKVITVH